MIQFLLIGLLLLGGAVDSLAAPRSSQANSSHSEVNRSLKKRPLETTSFVEVSSLEEQTEVVEALETLFKKVVEINHGRRATQPTN